MTEIRDEPNIFHDEPKQLPVNPYAAVMSKTESMKRTTGQLEQFKSKIEDYLLSGVNLIWVYTNGDEFRVDETIITLAAEITDYFCGHPYSAS